jgi:sugar lactone lactonase YvrE
MRTRWSTAAVLATVAALVVAAPAAASSTSTAREGRAQVIATFGTAESFAESATLDARGNSVVSVTHWTEGLGRLYVVSPSGHKTQFGPDIPLGGCAMLLGVDLDRHGDAIVAVFDFGGGDPSCGADTPDSGLLKVTRTSVSQLTTLPEGSWPNGVEVVGSKAYVTESGVGADWKVPIDRVTAPTHPWLVSPLLAPLDDPELALGANGVVYRDGTLWLTSYGQGRILTVRVHHDGSPGKPVVLATDPNLVTADGITLDCDGTAWVTTTHHIYADGSFDLGHVVTVSPRGTVRTVGFTEGHLDYPTQALFVSGHRLLVVNGSYMNGTPNVTLFG